MKTGMLNLVAQKQSGKLEELHRSYIYKGDWLANWEQVMRSQSSEFKFLCKQKLIVYKEFLFYLLVFYSVKMYSSVHYLFSPSFRLLSNFYMHFTHSVVAFNKKHQIPLGFELHTSENQSKHRWRFALKYTKDFVVVSLLWGVKQDHGWVLNEFINWCDQFFLQINVDKTKEMFADICQRSLPHALMSD